MTVSPIVAPADDAGIARAVACLIDGGLVAIPTDTVYGLAAALDRPEALRRIFTVKGRADAKNLPVLIADLAALRLVAATAPRTIERLAERFWPGPLTIAVPARPTVPAEVLAADGTVGVRLPDDPTALRTIAGVGGALAVTSANRSGEPPATTAQDVLDQLGLSVDLILDGGATRGGIASTVIRLERDERVTILRQGVISASAIERALSG